MSPALRRVRTGLAVAGAGAALFPLVADDPGLKAWAWPVLVAVWVAPYLLYGTRVQRPALVTGAGLVLLGAAVAVDLLVVVADDLSPLIWGLLPAVAYPVAVAAWAADALARRTRGRDGGGRLAGPG